MILNQIQQLRLKDKAKGLTYPNQNTILSPTVLEGLQEVLEENDLIQSKPLAKFYARTIFIGLALLQGDAADSKDVVKSLGKSSIYQAHKISQNPQEFYNFMEKQTTQYYQSEQHQLIVNKVQPLIGIDFCISTPYDFAVLAEQALGIVNLKQMISCFVDLALTLPSSTQMSSEEIFVGCGLYVYHKSNILSLLNWLQVHFQNSLWKGSQIKNEMIQLLFEINGEA